jgi:hypothetical protein
VSCTLEDKEYPPVPHEYSFTSQHTDLIAIYLKQMICQRWENVCERSIYHVVDNTADFEQRHQGIKNLEAK